MRVGENLSGESFDVAFLWTARASQHQKQKHFFTAPKYIKLLHAMMRATLFLVPFIPASHSFATSWRRHRSSPSCHHRATTRSAIFSTTNPLENRAKISDSIESLKKLLEQQRQESDETARLIRRLQDFEGKLSTTADLDDLSDEHLSTAASILSGFDYGFKSRSEGPVVAELKSSSPAFQGYGPPANILKLGSQQFMRNLIAIIGEYRDEEDVVLTSKQRDLHDKLEKLTLSSDAIWERETADGPIEAPLVILIPYLGLCYLLDRVFEDKYVPQRFFLLETVARMPYFSYIGMLHLYETLGFWRRSADVKRIHFAEEMNEFRHLLIMESLGGDQAWWVRFMAQHSAIVYFLGLCLLWALSPSLSYRFSELLETHAVNTYGQFLDENEESLKSMPPPMTAVEYYSFGTSDPFYAEFQTSAVAEGREIRRPGESMTSLYDVFAAIRADEGDHVSTMAACLDKDVTMLSPSMERRILYGAGLTSIAATVLNAGTSLTDGSVLSEGAAAISNSPPLDAEGIVAIAASLQEFFAAAAVIVLEIISRIL